MERPVRLAMRWTGLGALLAALLGWAGGTAGAAETVAALPGSDETRSIETCVEEALAGNAALQAERQRLGELRGQKKQAASIGLPTVEASGSWRRGRDPSFALDESFGGDEGGGGGILDSLFGDFSFLPEPEDIPAQTFWRTSVNARWEIRPGLIYNALSAAGLAIRRQDLLLVDAEHRTIESVLVAYHAVIAAGESLAALDAQVEAKREFLEVTRRRFHLGLSTPLDTLRAAVAYANLLPQRRNAVQELRDAGSRLNVLMGHQPLAPLSISANIPIEEAEIDAELAADRATGRPDLEQLALLETMMRKNRGAQKAGHRPYLSADASYGLVGRQVDQLSERGHDFWSASVMLTVPIFDGLLTRGQVQEAEAVVRRTSYEREEATRQARLEVRSILGDLSAARENLRAAALNRRAAQDANAQIMLRYELGKADYLSVLDTQADRLLAESHDIEARRRVLTLTASLKRALGFSPMHPLREIQETLARIVPDDGNPKR